MKMTDQTSLNFDSTSRYESNNKRPGLVANEFVLSYRKSDYVCSLDDDRLNNSTNIAGFLRKIWDPNRINYQESFYVLCFTTGMKLTGFIKIADGTVDAVPIDTKLMFTSALLSGVNRIILPHNHPSGSLKPSTADLSLTKKVIEAGELLDITVEDYIILTNDDYYSFRDNELI